MQLSKKTIHNISLQQGLTIPGQELFSLPEKVLQFGTGVLLRGLPGYFIDKANRNNIFNGRIVIVKSTSQGSTEGFDQQDGLYTLIVKGIEGGAMKEEAIINASISRVLSAKEQWAEIVQCAHNPAMKIIISNTTEVGIVLTDDDMNVSPPHSFPGKLLAFLYERYKAFNGNENSGMVIIPTELVTDNGTKLRSIVVELAGKNHLSNEFIQWLQSANYFCNSLVDRIVPGKLPVEDQDNEEDKLGYTDELMIMAEAFRLWAIETDSEKVKELLSFYKTDAGVVITPDIQKFRELKLRLLNGTHTFSCGLAFLAGFETVKEAMADEDVYSYIHRLMMNEIATALDSDLISYDEACLYADKVLDRFRNPSLHHKWISITMNYTSKMKQRNIPLLLEHYNKFDKVPADMALGFAAYLLFMKCKAGPGNSYYGETEGKSYVVQDEMASYFSQKWAIGNIDNFVDSILADQDLWGADISVLNDFDTVVKDRLRLLMQHGVKQTIALHQTKTIA